MDNFFFTFKKFSSFCKYKKKNVTKKTEENYSEKSMDFKEIQTFEEFHKLEDSISNNNGTFTD